MSTRRSPTWCCRPSDRGWRPRRWTIRGCRRPRPTAPRLRGREGGAVQRHRRHDSGRVARADHDRTHHPGRAGGDGASGAVGHHCRGTSNAGVGEGATDLRGIVLVGGSSRIPLVGEMLQGAFEVPLSVDTHPKHDVALGAALLCREEPSRAESPPSAAPRSESRPPQSRPAPDSRPAPEPEVVESKLPPQPEVVESRRPQSNGPEVAAARVAAAPIAVTSAPDDSTSRPAPSGAGVPPSQPDPPGRRPGGSRRRIVLITGAVLVLVVIVEVVITQLVDRPSSSSAGRLEPARAPGTSTDASGGPPSSELSGQRRRPSC
jgi:hypothetical protein